MSYRHYRHYRHHGFRGYRGYTKYIYGHYPRVQVVTQDYGWYILIGLIIIAAVFSIKL